MNITNAMIQRTAMHKTINRYNSRQFFFYVGQTSDKLSGCQEQPLLKWYA